MIHLKGNIWLLSFLEFLFWFIFHENGPAWTSWNIQSIHCLGFRSTCWWSFYAAWIWWRYVTRFVYSGVCINWKKCWSIFTWNLKLYHHKAHISNLHIGHMHQSYVTWDQRKGIPQSFWGLISIGAK